MNTDRISSVIESIFFVSSEPLTIKDCQKIFLESGESGISIKDIKIALDKLEKKYQREDSGLSILRIEDSYQLISRIDNNCYVEKIVVKKRKKSLSQAALEVLSIVAYRQPITKIEIEEIRGVKSDSVLSSLVDNELIYESGRLDKIGKPILYSTTEKFLIEFGMNSLKDLPKNISEKAEPIQINIGEKYGE